MDVTARVESAEHAQVLCLPPLPRVVQARICQAYDDCSTLYLKLLDGPEGGGLVLGQSNARVAVGGSRRGGDVAGQRPQHHLVDDVQRPAHVCQHQVA